MRALDEALELLHRFDSVADDLVRDLRLRRKRNPFDEQVSADLHRVGSLVASVYRDAETLVSLAEKYERERGRIAG